MVAIKITPITAGLIPKKKGSILGKLQYLTKKTANNNVINTAVKMKDIPANINPIFSPLTYLNCIVICVELGPGIILVISIRSRSLS